MSGASDKARFYLEQSVPELQELERKEVFTKEEIASIAKKRSDFEHKINARGSKPSDYARYAEFEMNLESLRKKRIKRLGVKMTGYSGQRRIFFVLDRATRKFHGDVGLWMQYIEYARREKANKKLSKILENVLRLHPTKAELWVYAARYAMVVQGSMTMTRTYMQKGLRFCKTSRSIWLECAKLEMVHIANFEGRRRTLGLGSERQSKERNVEADEHDADMIALPDVTLEDIDPTDGQDDPLGALALGNLNTAPALTGAIPIAIFDAAMKQFQNDDNLAGQFLDVIAGFDTLQYSRKILQHVVDHMNMHSPNTISTAIAKFKLPLIGAETTSPTFPSSLGTALEQIKASLQSWPLHRRGLAEAATELLLPILRQSNLETSLAKAIRGSIRQFLGNLRSSSPANPEPAVPDVAALLERLRGSGREDDARQLEALTTKGRSEVLRQREAGASTE